jgi:BASS family bile acid:Na+ symporter
MLAWLVACARLMTIAELVPLALKLSLIVMVFSLGLKTAPSDWICLLGRSLLAINVIMPLCAIAAVRVMNLKLSFAVALVALSLAPVPPLLPRKQAKAGGAAPYAVDLLAIASALSVIWIPVAVEIEQRLFDVPLAVSPWAVARLVALVILVPLLAGTLLASRAKGLAERLAPMLSKAAGVVLMFGLILILFKFWRPALGLIGDGTLVALVGFIVVGLAVGHVLGGPDESGRTVLALAAASRHPGVAALIVRLNFPEERAALAAILLYLVLSALVSLPYVRWRKRWSAP